MKVIDLHNDIAINSLYTTHKNFFEENNFYDWWNTEGKDIVNQVDLPRIIQWDVKIIFGACCLMPDMYNHILDTKRFLIEKQIDFYDYLIEKSNWRINQILNQMDLDYVSWKEEVIWLIKHIEGFYFAEKNKDLEILDHYYQRGIRSIWLTWNKANNIAWWIDEDKNLTNIGRRFLKKLQEKNIIIDLAHLWKRSFEDVLNYVDQPVMVSHTQLENFKKHPRNINKSSLKKIAQKNWIIGLMPYPKFLGSSNIIDYIESLKYVIDNVWIAHVSIGTDFDGFFSSKKIKEFCQSSDFPALEKKLKDNWFSSEDVHRIFFGNAYNFIKNVLSKN